MSREVRDGSVASYFGTRCSFSVSEQFNRSHGGRLVAALWPFALSDWGGGRGDGLDEDDDDDDGDVLFCFVFLP